MDALTMIFLMTSVIGFCASYLVTYQKWKKMAEGLVEYGSIIWIL